MADIQRIDPTTASDETLKMIHDLWVIGEAEDLPDEEPMPLAQRMADMRNPHDHRLIRQWVIRSGGEATAFAGAWMDREQNMHTGHFWVLVHPDHRGRGLGRAITTPVVDTFEEESRTTFTTDITAGRPEEALLERAGFKSAYQAKRSRLVLVDVDWSLMNEWVSRAPERASEYELIFLEYPVSEELVQKVCDLYLIMNTAPREELDQEDEVMTPEMLRDIEAKQTARGRTMFSYVAVHRPSGQWAGYTTVAYQSLEPHLTWQWDTGVHPDHRNMGLGRWLKAQMISKLHDMYPEVRMIDTENAGSNEPMLNINISMGFKPILITNFWQGDVATLRERLRV